MSIETGSSETRLRAARAAAILETMEAHHARLMWLCDRLEALADSLPDDIDLTACLQSARILGPTLRAAHAFEEAQFFPVVKAGVADGAALAANLARLRAEHRQDEGSGEEIAEVLYAWAMDAGTQNANATGYMLRAFFDAVRRHVAFERAYLVAPYRTALSGRLD